MASSRDVSPLRSPVPLPPAGAPPSFSRRWVGEQQEQTAFSSSKPSSQLVLRQAEERTRLAVECAGLVRRMEDLDSEIDQYQEWLKHGGHVNSQYKSRVQLRYEEARMREREEALRGGGGGARLIASGDVEGDPGSQSSSQGRSTPTQPRTRSPGRPLQHPIQHASGSSSDGLPAGEVRGAEGALSHLQMATRIVEVEADAWRTRVASLEAENERERQQMQRLLEFEMSSAIRHADEERSHLMSLLRDRDHAFEKLEAEYMDAHTRHGQLRDALSARDADLSQTLGELAKVRCERDAQRTARQELEADNAKVKLELQSAQDDGTTRRAQCSRLESEVSLLHGRLRDAQSAGEAHREAGSRIERELRSLRADQETQARALGAHRADALNLAEVVSARDGELRQVRTELAEASARSRQAQLDHDVKAQLVAAAQREAEMLQAKCGGLEADSRSLSDSLSLRNCEMEQCRSELMDAAARIRKAHVEHDRKEQLTVAAQREAQLLHAKCDNLEAALHNATSKQADHAMEKSAHKERADRIEEDNRFLREEIVKMKAAAASDRRPKAMDLNSSMASTTASFPSSEIPSPRMLTLQAPSLPPVRPPSSSRHATRERRDIVAALP